MAQLLSHKRSKTYLSKFVKENGYERVAHGIYAAPDIWPDELYLSGMKKILDKKRAVDHFKDGQAYVSDLYSRKKETTLAAYLCLGTEDGKASFRLEFPKKKEKKHLPVNDTGERRVKREESLPLRWRSSYFWHIGNGLLLPGFLQPHKRQDSF